MATTKGQKSEALSPKVADRLLELLSTDNEFRRLIKKDPQAAFLQAGYKPSKELAEWLKKCPPKGPRPPLPPNMPLPPWMCCEIDRIAPKASVIAMRDTLHSMFTSGSAHQPIQLNVGAASRLIRK